VKQDLPVIQVKLVLQERQVLKMQDLLGLPGLLDLLALPGLLDLLALPDLWGSLLLVPLVYLSPVQLVIAGLLGRLEIPVQSEMVQLVIQGLPE